jgi:hypothetical protein
MKLLALLILGAIIGSQVMPHVLEYLSASTIGVKPKFVDRNNAWTIVPGKMDMNSVVRCDGGRKG